MPVRLLIKLIDFLVGSLHQQAAKMRKAADKDEDRAVDLETAAWRLAESAKDRRREASRVQRIAQKLGSAVN